jgi:exonuclease SbcC
LKLKGFTSFRDEQEIDFTDLDLFVLWGPTGSGKSSLLDAMTYALFGYVERVGDEISQLVSHGQPRLAVTLEFAVGDQAYKVTRSTGAKGPSKVLLERGEGEDWESYGEGADKVRDVNRAIVDLIGLDYQAFTRSVVLPQGKFAEFLTGDAAKRRAILTELLGLELFKRMSQRANEIAKNAKVHLETKTELLEREYAGVDASAVTAGKTKAAELVEMLAASEKLEVTLGTIEARWVTSESSLKALTGCITEVSDAAENFAEAARDLDTHAKDSAYAEAALKAARVALAAAESARSAAAKKRATAEGKTGSLEDLAGARTKAESLDDARAEHEAAVGSLAVAEKDAKEAAAMSKKATAALAAATKERDAAARALAAAEEAHAEAHTRDAVGGLVADLKPGDPCPVCDRPLENLPKAAKKEIQAAKKALETARKADKDAAAALTAAETGNALALQSLEGAERDATRCKTEATNKKGRLDVVTADVVAAVGKSTDPLAQIDKRIDELRALIEVEEAAVTAEGEARSELGRVELAASKVTGEIDKIKARVAGVPLTAMCTRVTDAAPGVDLGDVAFDSLPEAPDALATLAATTGKELERLVQELEGIAAARANEKEKLLDEARAALPAGLSVDTVGITGVLSQARAATSQLRADVALAEKAAGDLATKLETKHKYEEEIAVHRAEQATYSALGKELKSDRIVQFLQAEALAALAQAASAHLEQLSSTRYRLAYEDDRFFVVDAWNGDERRSVKTLSGGETFQASLALALALSEQVQFLAVTERNRLDSLFLDEGFGTLDAETLEVVVSAIEQLGGDDRLVGVITHVPELADRLPIRFEVTKSQRGSSIKRAEHELAGSAL